MTYILELDEKASAIVEQPSTRCLHVHKTIYEAAYLEDIPVRAEELQNERHLPSSSSSGRPSIAQGHLWYFWNNAVPGYDNVHKWELWTKQETYNIAM